MPSEASCGMSHTASRACATMSSGSRVTNSPLFRLVNITRHSFATTFLTRL